jgi:hypothetical protein
VRSMRLAVPSGNTIAVDTPLRLSIAAAVAFPAGTVTASGLRSEAAPVSAGAGQRVRQ